MPSKYRQYYLVVENFRENTTLTYTDWCILQFFERLLSIFHRDTPCWYTPLKWFDLINFSGTLSFCMTYRPIDQSKVTTRSMKQVTVGNGRNDVLIPSYDENLMSNQLTSIQLFRSSTTIIYHYLPSLYRLDSNIF